MPDVNDKIDVRGDGAVVLYRRQNRDGTINDTYQMRIRIPLASSKGYFRGSTRESNQGRATQVALNKFDELYNKVKSGGTLIGKSFKDIFNEWKEYYPKVSKERLPKYIEWSVKRVGAYPYTFFVEEKSNPKIDTLTPAVFEEYWIYRKNNSFKNGKPFVPSNNTMRKECTLLNVMFSYAFERGYLVKELKIKRPAEDKNSRRPTFNKSEWRRLTDGMRRRIKESFGSAKRDRFYLQQFVLILANSGMRIGELRNLTWNDISRERYDDEERLVLQVSGKTGERQVVCNKGVEAYFERIYDYQKEELNAHPSVDRFIFSHPDGKPIQSMRKGFDNLLSDLKLTSDSKGKKRTLYSLRHTYATFRLSEETSPYLLARNMGTSVEMLEKHYGQVINKLVALEITKTRSRHSVKVTDQVYPF
jgi:integrase